MRHRPQLFRLAEAVGYGIPAATTLTSSRPQTGTAAAFSFAGFNGRRLGDNAPEVMFSLVTNSAVSTGLAATATSDQFPYVIPA